MGQPVPSSQPEDSDAGGSRCGQRRGCGPADRGPVSDGDAGAEQSQNLDRPGGAAAVAPSSPVSEQRGVPFVVQSGREMFMVANEGPHSLNFNGIAYDGPHPLDPEGIACAASQWVVAELRFDTESCTFVEASRARYDWPREAFGSMLARVAVGEEIDHELINRVTADFSQWLASQFIVVRHP